MNRDAFGGDPSTVFYFAYGSNLCLSRLENRVPGIAVVGPAVLRGYQLRWHKRSVDTSGKCNVVVAGTAALVHGALFTMPRSERPLLDRAEGLGAGYEHREVTVASPEGTLRAMTYVADPTYIDETLAPFTWYRDLVVRGAESRRLPIEYVSRLRAVDAVPDPDPVRAVRERRFLPCAEG